MKKLTLSLVVLALGASQANAQESYELNEVSSKSTDYNKWSIDLGAGINKPASPMTEGYYGETLLSPYNVNAGVRYMFNNKFGIKADFGYDDMKNAENSKEFHTNIYRASLQGVANLGRIMNFEDWTSVLNLQAHMGAGYTYMTPGSDSKMKYDHDETAHVILGLTGQVKLSKRVALNADFTMVNGIKQNRTFDGATDISGQDRAFNSTYYNATVGLSFYLGGNAEHADWAVSSSDSMLEGRIEALENRVADIENKIIDTDNDGVADYLDLEPNTPAGNMVDVKGRSIDLNKNGIPDSYEKYFAEKYQNNNANNNAPLTKSDSDAVKDMINNGYIAIYFDFDKSKPNNTDAVSFIVTYLNSNPNAHVTVNGYADVVGSPSYNERLSTRRASNVAALLEQAGIPSSRITINGQGSDSSFGGKHNLARRATFTVN